MNWKNWRSMWALGWWRYSIQLLTPWFAICVSSGQLDDVFTWANGRMVPRWFGVRLYWGHRKGWNYEGAAMMFRHSDESLSFRSAELYPFQFKWE